jgi:hypothetical protein
MSLVILQRDLSPNVRKVSKEELGTSGLSSQGLDSFIESTYTEQYLERLFLSSLASNVFASSSLRQYMHFDESLEVLFVESYSSLFLINKELPESL